MDVRVLAAGIAIGANKGGSAIETACLGSMAATQLPGGGFDGSGKRRTTYHVANCVQFAHRTPLPLVYRRSRRDASASQWRASGFSAAPSIRPIMGIGGSAWRPFAPLASMS